MKASPLQYLVEIGRATVPGIPHAVVYAAGSRKAKRRSLCGIDRSELQVAAPYDLHDERSYRTWRELCKACSVIFDNLC